MGQAKVEIYGHIADIQEGLTPKGKKYFKIKMACGHEMWITGVNDAPHESVPCTCGNPNHWFVKYEEEWV